MGLTRLENLDMEKIKQYYLQPEIIDRIFSICSKREVATVFEGKFYGKRPSTMNFPADIEIAVKNKATSFHGSVELWTNPMLLENHTTIQQMNEIRHSWDLIIDIDCDEGMQIAKEASLLIINTLESYGISDYSIKFSGNRGFHIGISHKCFPKSINYKDISKDFPGIPKAIVGFIKHTIKKQLTEAILNINPEYNEKMKTKEGELNPYNLIDVEDNWSNRHLFRLPYSINEKSGLVSLPITKDMIKGFKKDMAKIENIKTDIGFLDKWEENEAANLVIESMEWNELSKEASLELTEERKRELEKIMQVTKAISSEFFPPCIKNILKGIPDGRKRAIFILINFLQKCGWPIEKIEIELSEWNSRNPDPIKETYIKTQLNYAKKRKSPIMPPNCDSNGYYTDMTICDKDNYCQIKNIKNPATYAIKRSGALKKQKSEAQEYKCNLCDKVFGTKQGLGNHKARMHQPLRHGIKNKEKTDENITEEKKE